MTQTSDFKYRIKASAKGFYRAQKRVSVLGLFRFWRTLCRTRHEPEAHRALALASRAGIIWEGN